MGFMNTISVATGTAMTGGTAVKLDDGLRAVYSREIEFQALPIMKFYQFATYKEELGVEPGLEIKMIRFNNLTRGGKLTEGVRMTAQAMSSQMISITVGERGNAVAFTELSFQSAFYNTMAVASMLLGRDMGVVLDIELRDTAMSGTNVIYARDTDTGTIPESVLEMTADCGLSVATIKDGLEVLATNNCPKFLVQGGSEFYVCFIHPHQSRIIRDDPAWINASNYGAPELRFNGEIGRIDDVRFVETTIMPNGAAPVDTYGYESTLADQTIAASATADLFQAVLFGPDYYGFAVALPPELRDNGVQDFGREHGLAWYAIWGAGIMHDEYGVVIYTV